MTDFKNLDISTAKECLLKKEFSSIELTKYFIDRIEKSDLNCFITNTFENAIEMAKESDKKISRNKDIILLFIVRFKNSFILRINIPSVIYTFI